MGSRQPLIKYLRTLFSDLFLASLSVYLLLSLAELFKSGFVSNVINTNIFLQLTFVFLLALLLFPKIRDPGLEKKSKLSFLWMLTFAVIGGLLVYKQTESLGQTAIVFGVITGLMVIALSALVDNSETSSEKRET